MTVRRFAWDEPFELRPEAKLFVTVVEDRNEPEEEEWYALGRQSLARAFEDDETDYSSFRQEQSPRSDSGLATLPPKKDKRVD